MRLKGALLFAGYLLALAAAFLGAAELVVRAEGYRPWVKPHLVVLVEPGGRLFAKDPRLGFTNLPGSFVVTLADGYSFRLTHLPAGHRITHPLATYGGGAARREVWVFGCSYTHGWSVSDEETYPWLMQEALPTLEIVNFGCPSYGTLHALLQLEDALATQPRPAVVVYAAAAFHHDRNTFSRSRRKFTATLNRLGMLVHPYARLDRQGKLTHGVTPVVFHPLPFLERSAFSNFVEEKLEELDFRRLRSPEVTLALIREMAKLARSQGVPFLVAGIEADASTAVLVRHAEEIGAHGVDISVDLSVPGLSNQPHDPHPSARAHREYARALIEYLVSAGLAPQS